MSDTVHDVKQRGVRIPDPLWREIESAAAAKGISASEWIRAATQFLLLWERASRPPKSARKGQDES